MFDKMYDSILNKDKNKEVKPKTVRVSESQSFKIDLDDVFEKVVDAPAIEKIRESRKKKTTEEDEFRNLL